MAPNPTPELQHPTARIFLFVRPRMLALASIFLLALAGSAAALPVPAVPGVPGLPAMPALPATPDLPAMDQTIDTPVGSASAKAHDGRIQACAQGAAGTEMVPNVPLPALPVAAPDLPVSKDAHAAADLCAEIDAHSQSASLKGKAAANAAGQDAQLGLDTDANTKEIKGEAQAQTGFIDTVVKWFQGLF